MRRFLVSIAVICFSFLAINQASAEGGTELAAATSAPRITLTGPANGASGAAPATFTASATASDDDGSIVRVAFFVNDVLYAVDASAPYNTSITLAGGTFTITSQATDNSGLTTTSSGVTVQVAAPAPMITSISTTSAARSARLQITGNNFGGFGGVRADGRVEIGGVSAFVTRWTDTLITAYLPESSPIGATGVRVLAGGNASNAVALRVTARPALQDRIKWRFTVDADYVPHRAVVGADGTVYLNDVRGHVYALTADGGLKWVTRVGLVGGTGPLSLGRDGTIYVAAEVYAPAATTMSSGAIVALNPDGSRKWLFDRAAGGIIAGPNVGPDGNIFAVAEQPGIGLFALSPAGQLLFNRGQFLEHGPHGEEIVFGPPNHLYFAFNMKLFAYDLAGTQRFQAPAAQGETQLQPAVSPNGNVYVHTFPSNTGLSLGGYNASGTALWNFYEFPGNSQTHPDTGADNTIYVGRNLSTLLALDPNGRVKWRYVDTDLILFDPIVSPVNHLIFMGARTGYGEPGLFTAVGAGGTPLWRVTLPDEPGFAPYGQVVPASRARFTPDGQTAYISADILGDGSSTSPYSYFYAVDTSAARPPATVKVDDDSYTFAYGGWRGITAAAASGGGLRAGSNAGQTMTYRTGTASTDLAWVTYRGPDQGKAEVIIDNVSRGIVDLYSPTPQFQVVQPFGGLSLGRHTIAIKVLGQKNTASTGTEVRVDGFKFGTSMAEDTLPGVRFGQWVGGRSPGAYERTWRQTAARRRAISFTFSGTEFTWITATGPNYGQAQVVVDGLPVATVDLYSPTAQWQVNQRVGGLPAGSHTVQIVVLGTRNSASTGTAVLFDGAYLPATP